MGKLLLGTARYRYRLVWDANTRDGIVFLEMQCVDRMGNFLIPPIVSTPLPPTKESLPVHLQVENFIDLPVYIDTSCGDVFDD